MKVSLEGTPAELKELARSMVYNIGYGRKRSAVREVPAGDDVPNRFREEGVQ